jgi:branched-subunit amino acid aminotransferase/4-amino-4-deoxychorismate lyase
MRAEVEGRPTATDPVPSGSIGHFTAMQVRGRAVRGLELHLRRLREGNQAKFGIGLDEHRVRALIRHALADDRDATVRLYVRCVEASAEPQTVVTVRPPGGIDPRQRLRSVDYIRPTPHLKHLATEQGAFRDRAREAGFDDALLTEGLDTVVEAAIANIGFFDGSSVVWPDAPLLRGITMQLLETVLEDTSTRPVRLRDVSSFDGAFVTNARGIALVTAIDDVRLPDASTRVEELRRSYEAVPWDPI